jgi:hypothetical protein
VCQIIADIKRLFTARPMCVCFRLTRAGVIAAEKQSHPPEGHTYVEAVGAAFELIISRPTLEAAE